MFSNQLLLTSIYIELIRCVLSKINKNNILLYFIQKYALAIK